MGTIKRGILGGFSGKVGNVVGTAWKGIAVMKSMPLSVANPDSAGQRDQRGKFKQCVAVASVLLGSIVKPLWDRFAQSMSGFNDFVRSNLGCFTELEFASPQNLIISKGVIAKIPSMTVETELPLPNLDLVFTTTPPNSQGSASDIAYACVYNARNGDWGVQVSNSARSTGMITVHMPKGLLADDVLHCYLAFKSEDGTKASETTYKEHTVTA